MIKQNKKLLILTSIITVLPILAGLALWNQLPEQMPMHWNVAGEVDGWASKPMAVFGMPLLLLLVQWLGIFANRCDPKKNNHSSKMLYLVYWIVPALSIVLEALTYTAAMGYAVQMELFVTIFMGLLFIIIGNYLPKCKQNYTIGIKLPWTLHSEENWNRTHRLAGWVWVAGGFAILVSGFLGTIWIMIAATALMVLIPVIYSLILYRKGI